MYVSVPEPLSRSNVQDVFPAFHILDPESPPASLSSDPTGSLTSSSYIEGTWIPLDIARKNFDLSETTPTNHLNLSGEIKNRVRLQRLHGLSGAEAFDAWAAACASLDPAEAHETMNTVDEVFFLPCLTVYYNAHVPLAPFQIWRRFQRCFGVTRGLSYFEPCFRAYTRAIFEHCIAEGIAYVELRLVFWFE